MTTKVIEKNIISDPKIIKMCELESGVLAVIVEDAFLGKGNVVIGLGGGIRGDRIFHILDSGTNNNSYSHNCDIKVRVLSKEESITIKYSNERQTR